MSGGLARVCPRGNGWHPGAHGLGVALDALNDKPAARHSHLNHGQLVPVTQMAWAVPGYMQQVVPVPHAGQGHVVHA